MLSLLSFLLTLSIDQVHLRAVLQAHLVLPDGLGHGIGGTGIGRGKSLGDHLGIWIAATSHHIKVTTGKGLTGHLLGGLAERALGDVKSLHAVRVIDGEGDLDKLILRHDTLDSTLDTLLLEAAHRGIEIAAFLELDTGNLGIIEELQPHAAALDGLDLLVNHGPEHPALLLIFTEGVEMSALPLDLLDDLAVLGVAVKDADGLRLVGTVEGALPHLLPLA